MIFLREETREKIKKEKRKSTPIRKVGFREVYLSLQQNSFINSRC